MISDRVGLAELDTGDLGLLNKEADPSNKRIQKSKHFIER
jgi:hypothetical protein